MKYLEGNIFINFYIFGAAGILAVFISGIIYSHYGLRFSFFLSFFMAIIGLAGMLVIQMQLINFEDDQERDNFDEKFMPVLILILKMGIIMSFIITTQVSFTDDRIFPSTKRNTYVGSCGMIARSITIVAPIVNEWPAPYPIVVMLLFSILGIVTTYFFPKEDEFAVGEDWKEIHYKINDPNQPNSESRSDVTFHNLDDDLQDE